MYPATPAGLRETAVNIDSDVEESPADKELIDLAFDLWRIERHQAQMMRALAILLERR